jgi:hypothetical protein
MKGLFLSLFLLLIFFDTPAIPGKTQSGAASAETLQLAYPQQTTLPENFTPIVNYKPRLLSLSPALPIDLSGKARARQLLQQQQKNREAVHNVIIFQEKAFPWISLGIFSAIFLLSALFIYKPSLIKKATLPQNQPTPKEKALQSLEQLSQLKPPLQSHSSEFYAKLTKILDEFLANQYHLSTLTKTAEELIKEPEFNKFILIHESAWLSEWIQKSNRIKYGEYPIQLNECTEDFERILNFVKQI